MDEFDVGSRVVLLSIPEDEGPVSFRSQKFRKPRSLVQLSTPKVSAMAPGRTRSHSFGEEAYGTFEKPSSLSFVGSQSEDLPIGKKMHRNVGKAALDFVSGLIGFLLSSTIAISCATVVVGHGTPLSAHVSKIIDLNILGTAVLCIVLAWKSTAPWALGAVDVFVTPILAEIAANISTLLNHDMETVVPTVVVMVIATSVLLGLSLYAMGRYGISSIANYMPFPVIAGLLSGVGTKLISNGLHMATGSVSIDSISTLDILRVSPAICFALVNRYSQYRKWNVIITFPLLLTFSIASFYSILYLSGLSFEDAQYQGWLFHWPQHVLQETPKWYSWANLDFSKINFEAIYGHNGYLYCTLMLLGALKYSVFVGTFSSVFGRDINPDTEMKVIGIANTLAGLLGCNGGCHYLSAMGMLQKLGPREKSPAIISAVFYVMVWFVGLQPLQYCPKFVFGGLLLNIGLHFLQGYLVAPAFIMSKMETLVLCSILILFMCVGMLQSVAFGIMISLCLLVYRIHSVGCIRSESTAKFTRSTIDRTIIASNYLDIHGHSIHVLMLQGYLFFGTAVSILERVNSRLRCLNLPKLECLIVDFALVPRFDATALHNFSKLTDYAARNMFVVYFSGMRPRVERALRRAVTNGNVFYVPDVDRALEMAEDRILPKEIVPSIYGGMRRNLQRTDVVDSWELYLQIQTFPTASKLIPLAIYLDWKSFKEGQQIFSKTSVDIYFIIHGYVEVFTPREIVGGGHGSDDVELPHDQHQEALLYTQEVRLRKVGVGSLFGYRNADNGNHQNRKEYIAGSDCLLLLIKEESIKVIESASPALACELMKFINYKLSLRSNQSSKQISQLSRLLYSDRHDHLHFSNN